MTRDLAFARFAKFFPLRNRFSSIKLLLLMSYNGHLSQLLLLLLHLAIHMHMEVCVCM